MKEDVPIVLGTEEAPYFGGTLIRISIEQLDS